MPRVEIPEFARCCFCIPLRYGLLVWGYFKLISITWLVYDIISSLAERSHYVQVPTMAIIVMTMLCIDLLFNLIFVVAGHFKQQLLYMVSYYYSLANLVGYVVIFICIIIWSSVSYYGHYDIKFVFFIILQSLTLFIPVFLIQIYVTLLIRTEARKLTNNSNFEFVNNTSAATAVMTNADNFIQASVP